MIVVNEAQLKTLNQTMNANKRIVEANNAGTNEQTGAYQTSQQYTVDRKQRRRRVWSPTTIKHKKQKPIR